MVAINVNRNLGFTLIELIIVIIILSILAITALPRFIDFSKDARIAAVTAEARALESGVNLARQKWRLLGSPRAKDARDDVQLWGNSSAGQIDFNIQGWPAQSYAFGDSVLTNDGPDDCLSLYQALVENGDEKAALNQDATFQVTKSSGNCTYTLVADSSLGIYYDPLTGQVSVFGN